MSKLPIHKLPGAAALSGVLFANTTSPATALKYNLAAVTDPGVGNDSSQSYSKGSQWLNTLTNHVFVASSVGVGAAVWTDITAGGANGISRETTTVANAFAAGNVIRRTAGGYTLALADSASDANVLGVIETASGAAFTIVYSGKLTLTAHGFTVGAPLYLDPAVAGALTATEPSTVGQVSRQMGIVLDANTILIMSDRGVVIPAAAGTVTSVDATGGVQTASGAAITATGTIRGAHLVNLQTTTSYAIVTGDRGKLVTQTNGSAIANTIAQAGSAGFESGWFCFIQNRGAGTITLTPTTSTVDGAATLALTTGQGCLLVSDGTNYYTSKGASSNLPAGFTSAEQTLTASGTLTLAHGLGVKPRLIFVTLICQSADLNYTAGDEVVVPPHQMRQDSDNCGISIVPDATNINVYFGSGAITYYLLDKTARTAQNIVMAKWKAVFKAWL